MKSLHCKALVVGAGAFLCSLVAHAGSVSIANANLGHASLTLTSLKEARFRTTVRQQYDFSCGSAAVATLLTYSYGRPVSEQEIFAWMYDDGDQEKIKREGFSLLDMKKYLEANGYSADGFVTDLDKLIKANTPAILLINANGYKHFVVVKGMRDNQVLIGDPSHGTKVMPRTVFEEIWTNRVVFVIKNHRDRTSFNSAPEWRNYVRAPLGEAISREGLANITLLRPGVSDF